VTTAEEATEQETAAVDIGSLTYHDINKVHFRTAKERIKKATENFELAQERKREAMESDKHNELERQGKVQANLNDEREKLIKQMEAIKEDAAEPDEALIPQLKKYHLQSHDGVRLTFNCVYRGNNEEIEVDTTISSLFQRCAVAQIDGMKQSKKRTYYEKGIDFIMSFHPEAVVNFLTIDEFYDMRTSFVGTPCITHVHGLVRKEPISAIKKNKSGIAIFVADLEHSIGQPVAVASDLGAIWAFDPSASAFTWIWFDKS